MSTSSPPPSGKGERSSDASTNDRPPLPSTSTPFTLACPCLNVTLAARVPDDLQKRLDSAASPSDKLEQVWLPTGAETILHREMATFVRDESAADNDEAAWRKCWVCGVKVYRARGRQPSDMGPADAWVEVDFASGVVYGNKYEETLERTPLPFSGLRLDLPTSSSFGRPPRESTPVPYPAGNTGSVAKLLPPVPDPFFLPPPFIPSHAVLRDMCKAAVQTLYEKRDEIQRDIAEYITQRTGDMHRLEDQVRAEVESLWTRYHEGPGAPDAASSLRRQESLSRGESRERSRSPAVSKPAKERSRLDSVSSASKPAMPTTDLDRPSGVTISPPRISGQYNAHTAAAAASLLSASLSANAFHAPPSTKQTARTDAGLEELTKTMSNEGLPREVAMSYAFSAMDEYMAVAGGKKVHKYEEKVAENIEEEQEERDKGIDSWINMERAQARHEKPEVQDGKKDKEESRERKSKVTFSEPFKAEKNGDKPEGVDGVVANGDADGVDGDDGDDDEPVFDFETDAPTTKPPASPLPSGGRRRTMVEDNLSHAFAADAPSHRAAWRQWEARESMSTALRPQSSDDEEEIETETTSMARSMPVNIVKFPRAPHPVQYKTSLTDRGGVVVPHLLAAMRRTSGQDSPSPPARRGSIAIAPQRRGSRTISGERGERERDQVKSYAADPGAVFESLAEGASSESEDEATPQNGQFVPPHVLAAKRDDKTEVGWRSLAS